MFRTLKQHLPGQTDISSCQQTLYVCIQFCGCTLPTDGHSDMKTGTPMAYKQGYNPGAYRTLFPFFLIIAVVLLLVWRLIVSPGLSTHTSICPKKTTGHWVQPGDSCWEISQAHGCSLDAFKELNPKLDCASLTPGTTVCLPNSPQSSLT